ncbi:MAG: MOSC domain-containing protein [Acidobacteria bacterium]|nr:MOSC domain-containing protein [Acidobacteriota bacterium]
MANSGQAGRIISLWRYPVKSMMGGELNAAEVTERGLAGDRAYALLDPATGKVVSAKNPRKWPRMFEFHAAYSAPPRAGEPAPPLRIMLPDGEIVRSEQGDVNEVLSRALERPVKLVSAAPQAPSLEEYWPDIEGLARRGTVTDEAMPAGVFFDCAVIHLLTTATIDRLRELYPAGRFGIRRFRPNLVVECDSGETGFVENAWIGQRLAIGEVMLRVTGPCPRCVMTTLPQGDLPRDPGILRTAVQHNEAHVGIYAAVERGGIIRRGDVVRVE